jgi:hypothetical protein
VFRVKAPPRVLTPALVPRNGVVERGFHLAPSHLHDGGYRRRRRRALRFFAFTAAARRSRSRCSRRSRNSRR